ncbi:MAG TPA: carboxypeptidase-like regulatory domain-containing protein [Pseudonocardiaceae bacterium]|nr:carboxypeptidase-like regulatory domain-containing protein [Pseudonocardiaceae bacterium]
MTTSTPLIAGVVRAGKGDPVAAARVYVVDAPVSLPDIAALTGADGTFTIGVPAAGRYTLEANAEGWTPVRETIVAEPGINHIELRFGTRNA